MKLHKLALGLLSGALLFTSCSKDDEFIPTQNRVTGKYDGGIFVLNEGAFGSSNSTVSFISSDLSTVEKGIFSGINTDKTLGDTGQSIAFSGDKAYIIVNGSNKIEVVNRYTFESIATVTEGLKNPRYMTIVNGKGYITNWGDGLDITDDYIAVLDLSSNKINSSNTISVKEGPERIVANGNKLYIAQQGGWGQGNSITIVDLVTKSSRNLIVGDIPKGLEIIGNTLFVLCEGKGPWPDPMAETAGQLVTINLATDAISSTLDFSEKKHPNHLQSDNIKLYYTVGTKVYALDPAATGLPTKELLDASVKGVQSIYGFNVLGDRIYIGDAKDFSSEGSVYFYGTNGGYTGELKVGVSPNSFYWNN